MSVAVPAEAREIFDQPVLGHVSYLDAHGNIVTFPMWVGLDGDRILTSSPVGSRKGDALRQRPQVSVSVASRDDPGRWFSASGRVVEIQPDENLAFIDQMAQKYMHAAYPRRTPREIFVIEVDHPRGPRSWRGPAST